MHYTVMLATRDKPTERVIDGIMALHEGEVWDWYLVGGRWTGYFKMKPGTEGILGKPGVLTNPARQGTADQARKRDIDFEGMLAEARSSARETHRKISALRKGRPLTDKGFAEDLMKAGLLPWFTDLSRYFIEDKDTFAERSAWAAITSYGYIDGLDGEGGYVESGFSFGNHLAEAEEWQNTFREWLDGLPENCWLTVVDCHN